MLTETEPQGTVTYQYDLAGRRTRMEWPDAEAVTYDWYGGPDLITIGVAGTSNYTVATFVYDSLGRRTGMGGGNGAQSLYSYDDQSALATLTINPWNTADDQTATFTRDAGTRIIGRSGTNSAYDWSPGSTSPTTYASNGLNQTTSAGGVSLSYDDRGNMTARGSTTYGYDIANHLTSMSVSGTPTASLSYDPVGRLWEVAGAATTRFLYDGADLIAEYDTSGNVLRRYIHGPGTDEPLIWFEGSATNGIQTLHADERGSVTTVATGSAVAIDINTYDAYGARSSTNPTYASRFGFTGQEWLSDLGLYYYKARMYSPELGRFLQTDPIGYGDGMNIYAYVGNDPVNRADSSGLHEGPSTCAQYLYGVCVSWNVADVVVAAGVPCPSGYVKDDFGCWLQSQEGPSPSEGGGGGATTVSDVVVTGRRRSSNGGTAEDQNSLCPFNKSGTVHYQYTEVSLSAGLATGDSLLGTFYTDSGYFGKFHSSFDGLVVGGKGVGVAYVRGKSEDLSTFNGKNNNVVSLLGPIATSDNYDPKSGRHVGSTDGVSTPGLGIGVTRSTTTILSISCPVK